MRIAQFTFSQYHFKNKTKRLCRSVILPVIWEVATLDGVWARKVQEPAWYTVNNDIPRKFPAHTTKWNSVLNILVFCKKDKIIAYLFNISMTLNLKGMFTSEESGQMIIGKRQVAYTEQFPNHTVRFAS